MNEEQVGQKADDIMEQINEALIPLDLEDAINVASALRATLNSAIQAMFVDLADRLSTKEES